MIAYTAVILRAALLRGVSKDGHSHLRLRPSFEARRRRRAPQDDGFREDRRMSKSSTTTSKGGLLTNPHPGEILLEEFLKPMDLSQNALARGSRRPAPHQRDCTGQTRCYRRYRSSAGTLFRPVGRFLSRPADGL